MITYNPSDPLIEKIRQLERFIIDKEITLSKEILSASGNYATILNLQKRSLLDVRKLISDLIIEHNSH